MDLEREDGYRISTDALPFGLFAPDGSQAGFARAVTDGATFAWIGDLFVASRPPTPSEFSRST